MCDRVRKGEEVETPVHATDDECVDPAQRFYGQQGRDRHGGDCVVDKPDAAVGADRLHPVGHARIGVQPLANRLFRRAHFPADRGREQRVA